MNYDDKYTEYLTEINDFLDLFFDNSNEIYKIDSSLKRLNEALRHSLLGGGKRVRAVLVLAVCEALGGNYKDAIPYAAAIEMIHTYSLIHDDLPCMDDDDLRRGKPSCHIAFDEATALLTGDALLTYAFGLLSGNSLTSTQNVKAVGLTVSFAGISGMIGGQVLDLAYEKSAVTKDDLLLMYQMKTAGLLKCAATLGAIAANADDTIITTLTKYADNLGLAFQIIDDILDVYGDLGELGKPIGSDAEQDKTTMVTLLGAEKAFALAENYSSDALYHLNKAVGNDLFLQDLAFSLLKRTK